MNSKLAKVVVAIGLPPTVLLIVSFTALDIIMYSLAFGLAALVDKISKKDVWRVEVNAINNLIMYRFVGIFGQQMINHVDRILAEAGQTTLSEDHNRYWGQLTNGWTL